ncbi:MAG: helix-turn-helix transcriptional regulator [bacterium]|nr:helix-turn-helix transcriptional regulator [bacterium]
MIAKENSIKKEIGKRFRRFREEIQKAQHELASELNIYQSTITNIERGKTFPNIRYLQYCYRTYHLNINWLLTNQGEMLMQKYNPSTRNFSIVDCHIKDDDPKIAKYNDLLNYMQVPEVEQLILARLTESRALFREEIKHFFSGLEKRESR